MSVTPTCPRCGYDQSGAIATWDRINPPSCPLAGLCTECGHEFRWADVLRPELNRIPWLYEHVRDWWNPVAVWGTWRRATRPSWFWGHIPLAAEVRPGRLVLWVLLILLPLQIALGSAYSQQMVQAAGWWARGRPGWAPGPNRLLESLRAGLRPWSDLLESIADLRTGNPRFNGTYCLAAGLAVSVLIPLELLVLSSSRADARVRSAHIARAGAYGLTWILPVMLLMAAVLWAQQFAARTSNKSVLGLFERSGLFGGPPLLPSLVLAWVGWWWYQAIVRGFQFRHGRLVWALLMLTALLLAFSIALTDWGFAQWISRQTSYMR